MCYVTAKLSRTLADGCRLLSKFRCELRQYILFALLFFFGGYMRRMSSHNRKSIKSFNRRADRTSLVNVMQPRRGGIRL